MPYTPTTDTGKALKAFTGKLGLEKRSAPERMFIGSMLDAMLREIDKDPHGASESVKPLLVELAQALGMTPDDFATPSAA